MKQTMCTCLDYLDDVAAYWVGQHFPRPAVALGPPCESQYCSWCGQTVQEHIHCTCGNRPIAWSRVVRLGAYEPPLSTCILRGKYARWFEVLELIGTRLGTRIRGCVPANAVVVPMPMPYIRWWFRGINHTGVLSKSLAKSAGLKRRNLLLRKETPPQAGLTASNRMKLKVNTVRPYPWVHLRGRPVVLVDDVLTTGRSLEVATRALRLAGASTVTIAVAAVTNPPEGSKKLQSPSITT